MGARNWTWTSVRAACTLSHQVISLTAPSCIFGEQEGGKAEHHCEKAGVVSGVEQKNEFSNSWNRNQSELQAPERNIIASSQQASQDHLRLQPRPASSCQRFCDSSPQSPKLGGWVPYLCFSDPSLPRSCAREDVCVWSCDSGFFMGLSDPCQHWIKWKKRAWVHH